MTRSSLLALLLLCVAGIFAESAYASDEDLTSSAYLVFDPETGEFITVQDPNRVKQKHDALDPAAGVAKSGSKFAPTLPLAAGCVLAVGLLAGIVLLLHRRKGRTNLSGGSGSVTP